MTVYFENETEREFPFDPEEQAKKVISFVCDHENCPYETEVSVTIVEKETIREINAEHSDVIAEQAEEYGHSELREYSFLIVHSMLHLFGYDHMEEEERKQMEAKQREIMEQMGILRESN